MKLSSQSRVLFLQAVLSCKDASNVQEPAQWGERIKELVEGIERIEECNILAESKAFIYDP